MVDFVFVNYCAFFLGGSFHDIGLLLSSLTSFVSSTRLIRSGVGAIDGPDQSRQLFDQYNPSEVPEKIFSGDFSMASREKNVHFWYFQALYKQFCLL